MNLATVTALFVDLQEGELIAWVERGWVAPEPGDTGPEFLDIDVARVRLIHDLSRGMAVADDTMPVVLSLLDQVYELRRALHAMVRALEQQPSEVRQAVLDAVRPK